MDAQFIVRGEKVGLRSTQHDAYIDRWKRFSDDAFVSMVSLSNMPPHPIERFEKVWERVTSEMWRMFDVVDLETGECVGESTLMGITWPHGTGRLGLTIFDPAQRGRGIGTEAGILTVAYGFDGLGLHRVQMEFLARTGGLRRVGEAVGGRVVGVCREVIWAFGEWQDMTIMEALRGEMEPHPATAHLRASPHHPPQGPRAAPAGPRPT